MAKKPILGNRDRLIWSLLSRVWKDWASELIFVNPETVIRWRKRKFREFWRKKSQNRPGRPAIFHEHIAFIRRISSDHPESGEDRIALELEVKFGIHHACSAVRRYMVKRRPKPTDSQAWRSFLKNQAKAMWSCDFFVQHTVLFQGLYVFVVMEPASRKVIHFHVTDHPILEWTNQQTRNVCFEEQLFILQPENFESAILPEMAIETECRPNLPELENGKGNGIAQAPVLVGMAQENVFRLFLFARKHAGDGQAALQKPCQSQRAPQLPQQQSMSLGFNIVGDEARSSLGGDLSRNGHRAFVIGVVGVKKRKDGAGIPKNGLSHWSRMACLSRAPGIFPPPCPPPTSLKMG